MANTASGFIAEDAAYDKILYVSKDRLEALRGKLKGKKGSAVTKADVKALMYPDDMDDDSMLVPVDLSSEPEDFPNTCEDLTAKVEPKAAVEALMKAHDVFEQNKTKFSKEKRPIPMTVGDWLTHVSMEEDDEEEGGEEEELEIDQVVVPSPLKKRRRST
ncbi:exo1 [Symbiodinium natans]|uniref:Exo1 protein n=1 Tax=Symbiodinium natans TaxID=878477 RepID=A0A812IDP0_9DINO|nr:exo1 [Symbiodinium natans]